jgi:hypothetical protein
MEALGFDTSYFVMPCPMASARKPTIRCNMRMGFSLHDQFWDALRFVRRL